MADIQTVTTEEALEAAIYLLGEKQVLDQVRARRQALVAANEPLEAEPQVLRDVDDGSTDGEPE